MGETIKNLTKSTESKGEKFWIYFLKITGALMFIFSIYLPMRSMVELNLEEIPMTKLRWSFMCIGFFLVMGAKSFGILANNIGKAIANFLNKFSK